ncbi:MAG: PDZ domain-containing protein [Vampirovibrionales bacterium]
MEAIVKAVLPDTPAQEAGLAEGDRITAINGHSDLEDMFDYQQLVLLEDALTLTVQKAADGQTTTVCLDLAEADTPDEAGLVFASPLFGPIKTCNNDARSALLTSNPTACAPRFTSRTTTTAYRISATPILRSPTSHAMIVPASKSFVPARCMSPSMPPTPRYGPNCLKTRKPRHIMAMLGWLADLEVPFHHANRGNPRHKRHGGAKPKP